MSKIEENGIRPADETTCDGAKGGEDNSAVGEEGEVDTIDFGHEAICCKYIEKKGSKSKGPRYELQPAVGKDVMYKVSSRRLSVDQRHETRIERRGTDDTRTVQAVSWRADNIWRVLIGRLCFVDDGLVVLWLFNGLNIFVLVRGFVLGLGREKDNVDCDESNRDRCSH